MKSQNLKKLALALSVPLILFSCLKEEEQVLQVTTDAYMVKKLVGGQPAYGLAFYAYANKILKSGTVARTGGVGDTINLIAYPLSVYTLFKEPAETTLSENMPLDGEYIFNITAESGETNESSDELNLNDIDIPDILSTEVSTNGDRLDMKWTKVSGADGYVVKLADEDGEYIYSSNTKAPNDTTLKISPLTGVWVEPFEVGNTYTIEVNAFAYEDDSNNQNAVFNVEEISIGSKSIVWE